MHVRTAGLAEILRKWIILICIIILACIQTTGGFPSQRSERGRHQKLEISSNVALAASRSLGLLTFDLDDTLFPINEVVNDANEKMVSHMLSLGVQSSLQDFLRTMRVIRARIDHPVTYTTLRKMAIEAEMKRSSLEDNKRFEVLSSHIEACFRVWEEERHKAAERHLFDDVLPMLQAVRERHPDTCIAAVTNGKGNPLRMPRTLKEYFDFCVSGEDADVFPFGKPHSGIYNVTTRRYRELYTHHSDETHIWCHVGDCLANDVGASAASGAYAIWYGPADVNSSSMQVSQGDNTGFLYSTASGAENEKRAFLKETAKDLVAVRIYRLLDLPGAIEQLL